MEVLIPFLEIRAAQVLFDCRLAVVLEVMGRPFYIRDPAECEALEAAGAHADKCTSVVAEVAACAARILVAERRS